MKVCKIVLCLLEKSTEQAKKKSLCRCPKLFCLLQSSETTPAVPRGRGVPQVIWPSCSKIRCLMGNESVPDHEEWSNTVHMWADFSSKPGQSLDLKNWDMTATCWLIIDKLHSPISPAGGGSSFKSGHWALGVVQGQEDAWAKFMDEGQHSVMKTFKSIQCIFPLREECVKYSVFLLLFFLFFGFF